MMQYTGAILPSKSSSKNHVNLDLLFPTLELPASVSCIFNHAACIISAAYLSAYYISLLLLYDLCIALSG
jgi:hypothetical protein